MMLLSSHFSVRQYPVLAEANATVPAEQQWNRSCMHLSPVKFRMKMQPQVGPKYHTPFPKR